MYSSANQGSIGSWPPVRWAAIWPARAQLTGPGWFRSFMSSSKMFGSVMETSNDQLDGNWSRTSGTSMFSPPRDTVTMIESPAR